MNEIEKPQAQAGTGTGRSAMRLVIIESPYAGDINKNVRYLQRALRHSLDLGEAPFASHGFYPFVLDETNPKERDLGIKAGFAWGRVAEAVVFYTDLGWSPGMKAARTRAERLGTPVEFREIGL